MEPRPAAHEVRRGRARRGARRRRGEFAAIGAVARAVQRRHTTAVGCRSPRPARAALRAATVLAAVARRRGRGSLLGAGARLPHAGGAPHGLPRGGRQQRGGTTAGVVYRDAAYGDQLDVELDGRLFHDTAEARDRDFERDLDGGGRRTGGACGCRGARSATAAARRPAKISTAARGAAAGRAGAPCGAGCAMEVAACIVEDRSAGCRHRRSTIIGDPGASGGGLDRAVLGLLAGVGLVARSSPEASSSAPTPRRAPATCRRPRRSRRAARRRRRGCRRGQVAGEAVVDRVVGEASTPPGTSSGSSVVGSASGSGRRCSSVPSHGSVVLAIVSRPRARVATPRAGGSQPKVR